MKTFKEFALLSDISEKAVKKRYKEIPGYVEQNKEILFIDGSRYPYNLRNNRLKSMSNKCDVLLKATDKNKFIDHKMLKMEKTSFDSLVNELLQEGYLRENGTNNPYGVNGYDIGLKYTKETKCLNKNKREQVFDTILLSISSFLKVS